MALTDETTIESYRKKYAISEDVITLTVYRAVSPTLEQLGRDYIAGGDETILLYGTSLGGGHEEIVIGDLDGDTHTLADADGVWTEWTGDE